MTDCQKFAILESLLMVMCHGVKTKCYKSCFKLSIMGVNKNVEIISFEVIEMEKRSEIKIGPEIPLEYIDKIQTNSSFINFECIRIVSDSPKK